MMLIAFFKTLFKFLFRVRIEGLINQFSQYENALLRQIIHRLLMVYYCVYFYRLTLSLLFTPQWLMPNIPNGSVVMRILFL